MNITTEVTYILAALTILAELIALIAFVALGIRWKTGMLPRWGSFLAGQATSLSTIMAASAMAGSLFYSEVAHFTPCILCWYQRIVMYPMVVIGFIAGVSKKRWSPDMLALSLIGAVIAGYHYLLQIGVVVSTRCEEVGYSVSCSDRFFMTYGFVTIPMMAFGVFIAIVALQLLARQNSLGNGGLARANTNTPSPQL